MDVSLIRKSALPFSSFAHELVGADHGGIGVFVLFVDAPPRHGSSLHTHPYEEIFLTLEGEATVIANEQGFQIGPGDIVIVPPHTPHAFTHSGSVPADRHPCERNLQHRVAVSDTWNHPRLDGGSRGPGDPGGSRGRRENVNPKARLFVAFACLVAGLAVMAVSQGHADAPVPLASRVVTSPAAVKQTCAQIAQASRRLHATWRLVCPPRVPWQSIPAPEAFGLASVAGYRLGYTIDGVDAGGGQAWHWTFESGNPGVITRELTVKNAAGQREFTFTKTHATLAGRIVSIFELPAGETDREGLPAELFVSWTERGQGYQVGLYRSRGERQTYRDATAMAAAIIRRAG